MKQSIIFICFTLIISGSLFSAPKDKNAVDFVKELIQKINTGDNGYLNALRYFQYTSTTLKNNPSSYILSSYGKNALKESGIRPSDKGKMISILRDRSGKRIKTLWAANRSELLKMLPVEKYNSIFKNDVELYIEFHESPEYKDFMQKLQKQNPNPDTATLNTAGEISGWTRYREMAFWHRRIFEKNDEAVFSILKELKEHYSRQ